MSQPRSLALVNAVIAPLVLEADPDQLWRATQRGLLSRGGVRARGGSTGQAERLDEVPA